MSAWFTTWVAWRRVVPQRGYGRVQRIAAVCPEVRGELNRASFWRGMRALTALPILVPLVPVAVLHLLFAYLAKWTEDGIDWVRAHLPDFNARIDAAVHDAHQKVPIDEIRERIGEIVPRIMTKKSYEEADRTPPSTHNVSPPGAAQRKETE